MFLMVLRKMINNKWMVLCLIIGTVLAVAMVSSIPMFTEAVLNRMLRKDLEQYQLDNRIYPGRFLYRAGIDTAYKQGDRLNAYRYFTQEVFTRFEEQVPIEQSVRVQTVQTTMLRLKWVEDPPDATQQTTRFTAMDNDIHSRISITHGRMPNKEVVDGVYEVLATKASLDNTKLFMDRVYDATDIFDRIPEDQPFFVKVVGIYEPTDRGDLFWYDSTITLDNTLLLDWDIMQRDFIQRPDTFIFSADFYVGFDYHKLTVENVAEVSEGLLEMSRWLEKYKCGPVRIPTQAMLQSYGTRETQLRTILTVLQVPILLMLAFYMLMVSQLIVDYERGEIAVLKSRGSSRLQVFLIYLMESASIGAFAFVTGPLLGLLICHMLGASNGFLEFVSRTALQIEPSASMLLYALAAVGFSILMILIPAMNASSQSVVAQKLRRSQRKIALWKKMGLDIILLVVSLYLLYSYDLRMQAVNETLAEAEQMPIDPMLFFMSTIFILGAGLLILRLYPLVLKLVFWIGKRFWSPVMYASFLTVSRSGGQEQFLMLFLILTLSVGIFSANSARTINKNAEERIYYMNGTDIIMTADWPSNEVSSVQTTGGMPDAAAESTSNEAAGFANERITVYREPNFKEYESIEGIAHLAKVFEQKEVSSNAPGMNTLQTRIMGIEPEAFANVAFMPDELMPSHWYNYLNLMSLEPAAALVSRNFQNEGYKAGDYINISWANQQPLEVRIYAFIDYWPSYNPNDSRYKRIVVANLDYIQAKMTLEPYNVWAVREPGVLTQDIYDSIAESNLSITKIVNSGQELIREKNDPMLQGANGAMTMGFIVTMIITTIGFIIYWILSIKSRVLQFGIFRAMGMPMRKLYGMLLSEQFMISLSAIFFGIVIGSIASTLFVPLLQIVYSAQSQVPPFRVVSSAEDYTKIYIILASVLAVCFGVIATVISRIRMAQALKLGEE